MITMNTDYTDAMLTVPLGDGQVVLTNKVTDPSDNTVTLYFKNDQLISIDQAHHKATATRTIIITSPRNLESKKIALYVNELATAAKIKLESSMTARLTDDQRKPIKEYWTEVEPLLLLLGIKVTGNKKKSFKAQHRFKATIAKVPFYTDFSRAKATIYWQKRNEMRIESGAKMLAEAPLNSDGTLGFDARFAKQIREEHADAFDPKTFITTKDIVLKSVNEVGLFLYFGGTNSWLAFKGPDGRTIHDWTVLKS